MIIKAVHIEDEPRNIELLDNLVKNHCSDMVKLCGTARNNRDALALIKEKKPQLIYLDIELNQGNAFELLQECMEQCLMNFHVIFITAFNEYAVKAFRYNAIDYLLKPISTEELVDATKKAVHKIHSSAKGDNMMDVLRQLRPNLNISKIGVAVNDGILFINPDEIIRIEAKGSYSIIYLYGDKKVTSTKNLKDIESQLPESSFLRVHHSWLIHIKYLKKYWRGKNGYVEMEDGSTVMVSIRKKGGFLDSF